MTFIDKDGTVRSRSTHGTISNAAAEVARQRDAEVRRGLDAERKRLDTKLATLPSFFRGLNVGAFAVGGLNVLIPEHFWGIDLPPWARVAIGVVFLMGALNYLLRQRGLMIAKRISRS